MLPDFLNEFKSRIEQSKLGYIKISATPVDKQQLSLKQSKFLGHPFLPVGFTYPLDKHGKPMIMLAQINFAEVPALQDYPAEGILQWFVSPTDWYEMEDYVILYHEDITLENQTNFDFLTEDLYEDSPVFAAHTLTFDKQAEYACVTDFRFDIDFNGKDYYDYQETLSKEQQDQLTDIFFNSGHKIGGYAYFTQSDPRDYSASKHNDLLLLQIDTDEKIMFGDAGVANLFLNAEDLKNRNFEKAYFNWDCC